MTFSPDKHPIINQETIEGLLALGEGDPDPRAFLREIIDTYRKTTPDIHKNLLSSMDSQDVKQTIFFAHKLKGQSSNVGLERLSALCEEIESSGKDHDFTTRFPVWRPYVESCYTEGLKALKTYE